jgi:superfamily I DNA/RNA helicase
MLHYSDISILARTNRDIEEMKAALKKFEIDLSIVSSEEATADDPVKMNGFDSGEPLLLSTVHSAKGTEHAFVYVLNLESGTTNLLIIKEHSLIINRLGPRATRKSVVSFLSVLLGQSIDS